MSVTKSNWRLRSREVIRQVLDGLPADATEAQKRAAVGAAYPFGERAHHPYRMWLAEVKLALGRDVKPPLPTVTLALWHEKRAWWLAASCGWCDGQMAGGCLSCRDLHRRVEALVSTPGWKAWVAAVRADFDAAEAFSDWLEENGNLDVALLVRATVEVKCPVCKGRRKHDWTDTSFIRYLRKPEIVPCQTRNATGKVLRVQS